MTDNETHWRLEDIYTDDTAWKAAKDRLLAEFEKIDEFRGVLCASSSQLLAGLEQHFLVRKEMARLYAYTMMKSDENLGNAQRMACRQDVQRMGTEYETRSSFIEPEILRTEERTLRTYIAVQPGLESFRMFLEDLIRKKRHTLSEKEEKILASSGLMADGPYTIFTIFTNAEFPYPAVELKNGETVKVDPVGFSRYRALPDREDRRNVFQAFFKSLNEFQGTFGAQLDAQIRRDVFYARTRNYASTLSMALDQNHIPEAVYYHLLESVQKHLHTFHRYLLLRQRLLHCDRLAYHDLYAPVCEEMDRKIVYEEAKKHIVDSVQRMGSVYAGLVQRALEEKWIDVYPAEGKRSGAYMQDGGYDVHPYILMNYSDRYQDMSTLAHEIGHALHTYFSNQHQPFPTSRYSIFVAEVASTFNEALLHHHMLRLTDDPSMRLALQMEILDGIKGTLFRQSQFAEFELRIHQMAERGESLTGELLSGLYLEILRRYYGHDEEICSIEEDAAVEWAYVPHFYYQYYVYQYATSYTASAAFYMLIEEGGDLEIQRFIEFLSSGCKDYPVDLLRSAGIDMTRPEPFEMTMLTMNRILNEIESSFAT